MLTLRQLQKLAANDSMIVVDMLKSAVMSANAYLMLRIILYGSLDGDCYDKSIPIPSNMGSSTDLHIELSWPAIELTDCTGTFQIWHLGNK